MRLVFAGTPEFAATALESLIVAGHEIALVLTQPDRPAGRGMKLLPSPVKQVAQSHGQAVFQPTTLRDPSAIARVRDAGAQAFVVAAYGLILPAEALVIAPLGAINIHASLLPRWRGAAPIHRAILEGDTRTGITIMQMDEGLDTGAMLASREIPIEERDTTGSLHDRLAILGGQMIVEVLDRLSRGVVQAVPQPTEGATYARKISKSEALLNWALAPHPLDRAVRAFNPHPGAHSFIHGVMVKVWAARPSSGHGRPGEVLSVAPDAIRVACGVGQEGALDLLELQRPGGRRLPVAEFLKGFPIAPGECFNAGSAG